MLEDADEAVSAAANEKRRGGWEGVDPVTQWLVMGSAFAIVVALALTAAILYFGSATDIAPRTALERNVMVARAKTQQTPKDKQAWAELASACIRAGRYDEADVAIKALSSLTSHATVLLLRGDLAYARGDVSGARGWYEKTIAQAGKDYQARLNDAGKKGIGASAVLKDEPGMLARLYLARIDSDAGDYDAATKNLQEALKVDPNAADVLTALGDVQLKAGRPKDAIASYRKALTFISDYAPALEGLKTAEGRR